MMQMLWEPLFRRGHLYLLCCINSKLYKAIYFLPLYVFYWTKGSGKNPLLVGKSQGNLKSWSCNNPVINILIIISLFVVRVHPRRPSTPRVEGDVLERARTHIALMLPMPWELITKKNAFHIVRATGGSFGSPYVKWSCQLTLLWNLVKTFYVWFNLAFVRNLSWGDRLRRCLEVFFDRGSWPQPFSRKTSTKRPVVQPCLMLVSSVKVRRCVKCASLWRRLSVRHKTSPTKTPP